MRFETRRPGGAVVVPLATLTGMVLLGAPLGLLWAALGPHLDYAGAAQGYFASFAAAGTSDAIFVLLSLALGVIVGVAVGATVVPLDGVTPVALAVGCALAALTAARVGALVRAPHLHRVVAELHAAGAPAGAIHLYAGAIAFQVRGWSVLAVLPFAAMLGYAGWCLLTPGPGGGRTGTFGRAAVTDVPEPAG